VVCSRVGISPLGAALEGDSRSRAVLAFCTG